MAKKEAQKDPPKKQRNPKKRLAILKAAEEVFSKKLFHEATIAEIAKKANVSDATIYEYFSTKEELLFSIPAEIVSRHMKENIKILQFMKGSANKLRTLIHRHLNLYATNENFAKVAMLILKTNRKFLKTKAYKIVQESASLTLEVLNEGKQNGEFRPDLDPYLARSMIWGTIEHLVIRKYLLGKPADLLSLTDQITEIVLAGIQMPQSEKTFNIRLTLDENGHLEK